MATPGTWTDEEAFAIAEAAFMCGAALSDDAFGLLFFGPQHAKFMSQVDEACHVSPSPARRRKVLRVASAILAHFGDQVHQLRGAEPTITPERVLADAGITTKRQALYQRRMSSLLAGRT